MKVFRPPPVFSSLVSPSPSPYFVSRVFRGILGCVCRSFSLGHVQGRGDSISSMINKDLLCGLRIEMKSLGMYVPMPPPPVEETPMPVEGVLAPAPSSDAHASEETAPAPVAEKKEASANGTEEEEKEEQG